MTIYLPTLLLVAICYSTNFYLPDLFSAQVAVNLTCMLVNVIKSDERELYKLFFVLKVLATMFVSVSDNLPKTSYIKMVDIWLVTTLCIPFIEVSVIQLQLKIFRCVLFRFCYKLSLTVTETLT